MKTNNSDTHNKARYEILKQTYALFKKDHDVRAGMCFYFKHILDDHNPYNVFKIFPELLNCKPLFKHELWYWFPLDEDGWQKRDKIFKKLLKELKP